MFIKITDNLSNKLTTSERMVVDYINNNENKLATMSIVDIADATFTSTATVSRAIKKCGLKGFTEFRYRLLSDNKDNKDNKNYEAYKGVNSILEKSLMEVSRTLDNISLKDIVSIVNTLKSTKRIYIIARGLTELVANEFDYKLKLLGYNSFLVTDPNIMVKITERLDGNETLVVFSLRGETQSIVDACKNAKKQNCTIISCCCEKQSTLKDLSDISIIGEKHKDVSIKDYEVTSRIPLNVISRVIIDYLINTVNE